MKFCELCRSYIIDHLVHPLDKTDDVYYLITHKYLVKHIYHLSHFILRLQHTLSYNTMNEIKEMTYIDLFLENIKQPSKQDKFRHMFKNLKKNTEFMNELQYLQWELLDNSVVKIPEGDKQFMSLQLVIELSILPLLEELISLHNDHSFQKPIEYYDPNQKVKVKATPFTVKISRAIEDENGNIYD